MRLKTPLFKVEQAQPTDACIFTTVIRETSFCEMAFHRSCKLLIILQHDADQQCQRFFRWIDEVLQRRKSIVKQLSLLRRKLQYYTHQQAKGARILSRHLEREVRQEDIDKLRIKIDLVRADAFLVQCKASHLNKLATAYLSIRSKKGPYEILFYALPARVYEVYGDKINNAVRA